MDKAKAEQIRNQIKTYNHAVKLVDILEAALIDLLEEEFGEIKRDEIMNDLRNYQDFISYYPLDEKAIEKYLEKGD